MIAVLRTSCFPLEQASVSRVKTLNTNEHDSTFSDLSLSNGKLGAREHTMPLYPLPDVT